LGLADLFHTDGVGAQRIIYDDASPTGSVGNSFVCFGAVRVGHVSVCFEIRELQGDSRRECGWISFVFGEVVRRELCVAGVESR
jgi:hypothetical protein